MRWIKQMNLYQNNILPTINTCSSQNIIRYSKQGSLGGVMFTVDLMGRLFKRSLI